MMNISFSKDNRFAFFDFLYDGKIIQNAPLCGMTLKSAGSMRFRWQETNENRNKVFKNLCSPEYSKSNLSVTDVPVELIHSKSVITVAQSSETKNIQADGIITINKNLMPVVTVADCMPLFLFDSKKQVFGIVHSGWKGTGIAVKAIEQAAKDFKSKAEDFSVILGPHIHDCCYIVNQERADYFAEEFTPECVKPLEENGNCYAGGRGLPVVWNNGGGQLYRLSLLKANLASLKKAGVPDCNINVINQCTCCNTIFGSNRRETAEWEAMYGKDFAENIVGSAKKELPQHFTVQAAFIRW